MRRLFLALLLSTFVVSPGFAAPLRWYVVLGSFGDETGGPLAASAMRKRVVGCVPGAWTEYTSKMRGFRPGFVAVIVGPLGNRAAAERVLYRALPCAPDAYVKQAEEGGE